MSQMLAAGMRHESLNPQLRHTEEVAPLIIHRRMRFFKKLLYRSFKYRRLLAYNNSF